MPSTEKLLTLSEQLFMILLNGALIVTMLFGLVIAIYGLFVVIKKCVRGEWK